MKPNIGVIFGGMSVEHEVSIISGLQALHAIDKNQYNGVPIYISKQGKWYSGEALAEIANYENIPELMKQVTEVIPTGHQEQLLLQRKENKLFKNSTVESIDVAFPVIHGSHGEDGSLQGLLEMFNVPYSGCDISSSAIAMDKLLAKVVLKSYDLPIVDYVSFDINQWFSEQENLIKKTEEQLGFPVIVKPSNLGSSIGISVAENRAEFIEAVENAGQFTQSILIEKLVENLKELNCSVLGNQKEAQASAIEEPIRSSKMLNFTDKYEGGGKSKGITSTERILPAEMDKELRAQISNMAKQVFNYIGANGVIRIDFLQDMDTQKVYVNEINTIPGSLSFYLWEESGLSFTDLTSKIIELALERSRDKNKNTYVFESNILSARKGGKLGAKS